MSSSIFICSVHRHKGSINLLTQLKTRKQSLFPKRLNFPCNAAFRPKTALVVTQIKAKKKIITNSSPNSTLPRSSTPSPYFLPPFPLFLHPAPGHVLFIGISPQSAVLIVHLCRSRGAVCNMAPVIICAHCVPVLKKYLTNPYGAGCRLPRRRG